MNRQPSTTTTTFSSALPLSRPNLTFDAPGARHDSTRTATRYEALLRELWRNGKTEETRHSVPAIVTCAHTTLISGERRAAARLYTELARSLEAIGEFDAALTLVSETLSLKEHIDIQTLNEVMRLRARLALDADDIDDALTQIAKVERPIISRSSTMITDHSHGHIRLVRDSSEAGESTREDEGKPTTPTLLLKAEIHLFSQNAPAARLALDEAARQLLKLSTEERDIDETAMLQLLRLLDPQHSAAASKDALGELAETWSEKCASAPVISRINAAAGELDGAHAINTRERDRYILFGREARLHQRSPREQSTQSTPETRAGTPDNLSALTEPSLEEKERIDSELFPITDDDLQQLFHGIPFVQPQLLEETSAPSTTPAVAGASESRTDTTEFVAPGAPSSLQTQDIIESGRIGEGALTFYNILQNIEANQITGTLTLTSELANLRIHFADGQLSHAEHLESVEDDPRAAMKYMLDLADARASMSYTVEKKDTLEAPRSLFNLSSSNWGRLLVITSGASIDEIDPEAPPAQEEEQRPPAFHARAHVEEPALVTSPLDAHLSHILAAKDVTEIGARLHDAALVLGATDPEVEINVLGRQLAFRGDQTTVPDGEPHEPVHKATLINLSPTSRSHITLLVRSATTPTETSLQILSTLSQTARFVAETLPRRGIDPTTLSTELIGVSSSMLDVKEMIHRVATLDGLDGRELEPVLITGESGTGKEVVANLIHSLSGRKDRELVVVNMTAIGSGESGMADSAIFGHKKGSFTGASSERQGKIKQAETSSLFLDEIGEIGLDVQAKLLRVIEYADYVQLGADNSEQANVRFIMATNRDVRDTATFRSDLLFRCTHIQLPPLRTRREDIPLLLKQFGNPLGLEFSEAATAYLCEQDWPGNVRQLRRAVKTLDRDGEGTITTSRAHRAYQQVSPGANSLSGISGAESLPSPILEEEKTVAQMVEAYEATLLRTLYEEEGSISGSLRRSGFLNRATLTSRLKKYNIISGISNSKQSSE
jgi:DNA-binding NtrC family response regulator